MTLSQPGIRPYSDVFDGIAHPVRRQLIEALATGDKTVTDLADPMPVSRSAVSQHLRLLHGLGLVSERRRGRHRVYRLEREALEPVSDWLLEIDDAWAQQLRRLGEHLESNP
jgi:DNA-binding transcriptional ArsR family regulator